MAALGPLNESRAASSPMASASLVFIVSSTVEKADPATRNLIRSHVMRGKKQKLSRDDEVNRRSSRARLTAGHTQTQAAPVKWEEVIQTYASPLSIHIPGRVGSDLSFANFADDIEPILVANITRGVHSSQSHSFSFYRAG